MIDDVMAAGFPVGCADTGEGSPLVLLHCSGADRHVWTRMMQAWDEMQTIPPHRILRPELFGCGETGRWPNDRPIALRNVVDLVCRAIAALDGSFDLVAHSFGGAVALQLARLMPHRVRTLTLIEPTAFYLLKDAGAVEDMLFSQVSKVAQTILTGAAIGTEQARQNGMACFIDYWNGAGKWESLPPDVKHAMAQQVDVVAQDFSALYAEPTRLADYRDLQIPTLLVNGLKSPEPVQHIAAMLEDTLPNVERCCLPDAGHMIPLSHATQLAGLIASRQLGQSTIDRSRREIGRYATSGA